MGVSSSLVPFYYGVIANLLCSYLYGVVAYIYKQKRFVQTIEKSAFSDWQDVWHLEENLQKNVKTRIEFCSICCFLSKIHLYASFFLKKIWCVRKQLVILHRLKKVKAFDNGKRLYSNNG